jgi:TetR/AcrR family fatty acid metabolism transcriptional regulator
MPVSRTPESPRESAAARSRAATRERLIESARRLFAERGLRGVTTHDIARAAGVAAGTFYLHFKDKRELFRVIAAESVAVLRERLDKSMASARDLPALVRAHATALMDFADDHRDLVRILFSADPDAAAVSADVLDELAGAVAARRRERQLAGAVSPTLDATVLSQALVGMWARVVAWWAEDPTRAPRALVIETLTRIQLEGTQPGTGS